MFLFENDPEFYRPFILKLFPKLNYAEIKMHQGWHSIAIEVDDRLIFKFPKNEAAKQALMKEAALLVIIQPRIKMHVPEMELHQEGKDTPLFSIHKKIPGEALETKHYEVLPENARNKLAKKIAQFYVQLHSLNPEELMAASAGKIENWHTSNEIIEHVIPLLNKELKLISKDIVDKYIALPPDPYGTTYGFFDGHGWNMAFDHKRKVLNGIYDFADSGFGSLHQEFIYTNFIHPDLTERVITAYETLSKRSIDRNRVNILTGYHRLSEIKETITMPEHLPEMILHFEKWTQHMLSVS